MECSGSQTPMSGFLSSSSILVPNSPEILGPMTRKEETCYLDQQDKFRVHEVMNEENVAAKKTRIPRGHLFLRPHLLDFTIQSFWDASMRYDLSNFVTPKAYLQEA